MTHKPVTSSSGSPEIPLDLGRSASDGAALGPAVPESVREAMNPCYPTPTPEILAKVQLLNSEGEPLNLDEDFDPAELRVEAHASVVQVVYDRQFLEDAAQSLGWTYQELYDWLTDTSAGEISAYVTATSVKYIRSGPDDFIEIPSTQIADATRRQEAGRRLQETVVKIVSLYNEALARPESVARRNQRVAQEHGVRVVAEGDLAPPLTRELGAFLQKAQILDGALRAAKEVLDSRGSTLEQKKKAAEELLSLAQEMVQQETELNAFLEKNQLPTYTNPRLKPYLEAIERVGKELKESKEDGECLKHIDDLSFLADLLQRDCSQTERISDLVLGSRNFSQEVNVLGLKILDAREELTQLIPGASTEGRISDLIHRLGLLSQTMHLVLAVARQSSQKIKDEEMDTLQQLASMIADRMEICKTSTLYPAPEARDPDWKPSYIKELSAVQRAAFVISDQIAKARIELISAVDPAKAFVLLRERATELDQEAGRVGDSINNDSRAFLRSTDPTYKAHWLEQTRIYSQELIEIAVASLSLERLTFSPHPIPDRKLFCDLIRKLETLCQKQGPLSEDEMREWQETSASVVLGVRRLACDLETVIDLASLPSIEEKRGVFVLEELQKEVRELAGLVDRAVEGSQVEEMMEKLLTSTDRLLQLQSVLKTGMGFALQNGTDTLQRYEIATLLEERINQMIGALSSEAKKLDLEIQKQGAALPRKEEIVLQLTALKESLALLQKDSAMVQHMRKKGTPGRMGMQVQSEVRKGIESQLQLLKQQEKEIGALIELWNESLVGPFSETSRQITLAIGERILSKALDLQDGTAEAMKQQLRECAEAPESEYFEKAERFFRAAFQIKKNIYNKAHLASVYLKVLDNPASLAATLNEESEDLDTLGESQYLNPEFLADQDLLSPQEYQDVIKLSLGLQYSCQLLFGSLMTMESIGRNSLVDWIAVDELTQKLEGALVKLSQIRERMEGVKKAEYDSMIDEMKELIRATRTRVKGAPRSFLLMETVSRLEAGEATREAMQVVRLAESVAVDRDTVLLRDQARKELIAFGTAWLIKESKIEDRWVRMGGLKSPILSEHRKNLKDALRELQETSLEDADRQIYRDKMNLVKQKMKEFAIEIDQLDKAIYEVSFASGNLDRVLNGYSDGEVSSFGLRKRFEDLQGALNNPAKKITKEELRKLTQEFYHLVAMARSVSMARAFPDQRMNPLVQGLNEMWSLIEEYEGVEDRFLQPYLRAAKSAIEQMVSKQGLVTDPEAVNRMKSAERTREAMQAVRLAKDVAVDGDTVGLREEARQALIASGTALLTQAAKIEADWLRMGGLESPSRFEHRNNLANALRELQAASLEGAESRSYLRKMHLVKEKMKEFAIEIDQLDTAIYEVSFASRDLDRVLNGYGDGEERSLGLMERLTILQDALDSPTKKLEKKVLRGLTQEFHHLVAMARSVSMALDSPDQRMNPLVQGLNQIRTLIEKCEGVGDGFLQPYLRAAKSAIEQMVQKQLPVASLPEAAVVTEQTGRAAVLVSLMRTGFGLFKPR